MFFIYTLFMLAKAWQSIKYSKTVKRCMNKRDVKAVYKLFKGTYKKLVDSFYSRTIARFKNIADICLFLTARTKHVTLFLLRLVKQKSASKHGNSVLFLLQPFLYTDHTQPDSHYNCNLLKCKVCALPLCY